MKKSTKLLAALFATVMLLSGAVTAVAAADNALPAAPVPGFPVSSYNPYFSYGGVLLPDFDSLTPEEQKALYSYYYWNNLYPSYSGNVLLTPGLASIYKANVEMNQFTTHNLGFGSGVSYYSNNPAVANVNAYGYVYASAAGEATIAVSNEYRTFALITVTVTALDPDAIPNLEIATRIASSSLLVGQSTTLYAYVTINGATYPWHSFPYELEYIVADEKVISFDESTGLITALKKGTTDITISIKDSSISKTVTIYVVDTLPTPSRPNTWFPIIGGGSLNGGSLNGGWTVTIPGYGTIGGIIPGFNYNWGFITGFDSNKYELVYKPVFADGKWTLALVPVLKSEVKEEPKEEEKVPTEPAAPELTPEEKEKLEKEAAEAKRLAELKANIEKAKEGKLEWYDVYSDIYGDSYYYAGVSYVLTNDLLPGNEDGSFGKNAAMTYGDLADLFCKYLDITKEKLTEKKLIPAADADKELTREALAVAFYNVAKELDLPLYETLDLRTYKDYNDIDADAREAFAWASANYIFDITTTEVNADGIVDKAQLAQSIYRLNQIAE